MITYYCKRLNVKFTDNSLCDKRREKALKVKKVGFYNINKTSYGRFEMCASCSGAEKILETEGLNMESMEKSGGPRIEEKTVKIGRRPRLPGETFQCKCGAETINMNHLCSNCLKEKQKNRRNSTAEKKVKGSAFKIRNFIPTSGSIIVLNFDEYPDLLEQLSSQAKTQFRTIDQQILFWVNEIMEKFHSDGTEARDW